MRLSLKIGFRWSWRCSNRDDKEVVVKRVVGGVRSRLYHLGKLWHATEVCEIIWHATEALRSVERERERERKTVSCLTRGWENKNSACFCDVFAMFGQQNFGTSDLHNHEVRNPSSGNDNVDLPDQLKKSDDVGTFTVRCPVSLDFA